MEEICQASNTAKYFCLKQQWWWHQWNLNKTIHFFTSVFNLIGSKWNLVAVTTMKKVSVAWPLLSFIGSQFSHILVFLFETTVVMVPVKPQQQQWQQWMKHSGSNNNEKSKCYMTSHEFYWITILTHWITILTHFGINSHMFWYSCLKQQWWWCQWNLNETDKYFASVFNSNGSKWNLTAMTNIKSSAKTALSQQCDGATETTTNDNLQVA